MGTKLKIINTITTTALLPTPSIISTHHTSR
jgi:hypothetical protein